MMGRHPTNPDPQAEPPRPPKGGWAAFPFPGSTLLATEVREKGIPMGIDSGDTPIRVSADEETVGLDASQHAESAYPSFEGLD